MALHDLAGKPAPREMLVDVGALIDAYFSIRPDSADPVQRVSFGTSGHRGSSLTGSFNEDHILAITQAICDYKREYSITGPLFLGKDTHGLSEPAFRSALEVLSANAVNVMTDETGGFTPTPVISHAILEYNRARKTDLADGVVITPSHNPHGRRDQVQPSRGRAGRYRGDRVDRRTGQRDPGRPRRGGAQDPLRACRQGTHDDSL